MQPKIGCKPQIGVWQPNLASTLPREIDLQVPWIAKPYGKSCRVFEGTFVLAAVDSGEKRSIWSWLVPRRQHHLRHRVPSALAELVCSSRGIFRTTLLNRTISLQGRSSARSQAVLEVGRAKQKMMAWLKGFTSLQPQSTPELGLILESVTRKNGQKRNNSPLRWVQTCSGSEVTCRPRALFKKMHLRTTRRLLRSVQLPWACREGVKLVGICSYEGGHNVHSEQRETPFHRP
jgi:hypothetical protein